MFDQAVHILGGNVNVISKWMQSIRLTVISDVDDNGAGWLGANAYAGEVVAEVAALTGLPIDTASDSYADSQSYLEALRRSPKFTLSDCAQAQPQAPACANFFVILTRPSIMARIVTSIPLRPVYQKAFANPDNITCFFSPFQTGYMEIRQALVFVRNDLSPIMQRTCLQEEIYQSFGMFNDYTGSQYYSFNNQTEPKAITRYDRALLQTIYEPDFGPGAPVFRVVTKLMQNLGIDPYSDE